MSVSFIAEGVCYDPSPAIQHTFQTKCSESTYVLNYCTEIIVLARRGNTPLKSWLLGGASISQDFVV